MSLETKFLIGLLLLMGVGCLLCGIFDPSNNTFNDLSESAKDFGESFTTVTYKSIGNVFLQGGSFLIDLFQFFGTCVFWNFSFFEGGFVFVQILLILINLAIMTKIGFDVLRSLKPFGS
jgi:hypothetical protein